MLQSVNRIALASFFVLSAAATADAARISVDELSTGGGTLVHDGTGDVSSSDGSAKGDSLLLSSFGITNGNLANDLGLFTLTGYFSDRDNLATSVNVTALWLIGTIDIDPLPACATCGLLSDVNVGSSLSLDPQVGDTRNVLFAIAIIGAIPAATWVGPANLPQPQNVPFNSNPVYSLTPAQIAFIVNRMSGFTVDQVRFGISTAGIGLYGANLQTDVGLEWDLQGPVATPEPGTMLLLGGGIAAAGLRRVRQRRTRQ